MSTDAQTLLSSAQCYLCLGISIGEALQLALLAQIAGGGGSGTGVQQTFSSAAADPNVAGVVPTNTTIANWFYQDPGTGGILNVWYWSITNQNWVQYSG